MQPNKFIVQMNIDGPDRSVNKLAFDLLQERAERLQQELGEPLTWKRLDEKKMCRIQAQREGSIDSPEEVLNELKEWSVDLLPRFKQAFGPSIRSLDLQAAPDAMPRDELA